MKAQEHRSLINAILARAEDDPTRVSIVFASPEHDDLSLQTHAVVERSAAQAAALASFGIGCGDVVLLALEEGPELVTLFLGAMSLGAIPCIFPSSPLNFGATVDPERLLDAAEKTKAKVVIVARRPGEIIPTSTCRVVELNEIESEMGSSTVRPTAGTDIAFLQWTSGSMSGQRVVPMMHRAVLRNIDANSRSLQVVPSDTRVAWIPLHHIAGLVFGVLAALIGVVRAVVIPRLHWLARPVSLMQAIDRYSGTITIMPNFAFNYCVQRIEDREMEGLDLSSWRVLYNAGEPIRPESFTAFAQRFARWGLRRNIFVAGYGATEAGVISCTRLGRNPQVDRVNRKALQQRRLATPDDKKDARTFVSCGTPLKGVELQIRSDTGSALPERHVGEVVVRSDRVFAGYYGDAEATAECLQDGWFRTGDLGYTAGGELFICGRLKNLILVGGANVFAEDVEVIAAAVEGLSPGRVVAFGAPTNDGQTERIVLVCELEDDVASTRRDLELKLRQRVKRKLDVTLSQVEFVPLGWIVKTSAGKLGRWETQFKWQQRRP